MYETMKNIVLYTKLGCPFCDIAIPATEKFLQEHEKSYRISKNIPIYIKDVPAMEFDFKGQHYVLCGTQMTKLLKDLLTKES